jgi:hypothetical protein
LEQAPKVVRRRSKMHTSGGGFDVEFDRPDGVWGDWWSYDGKWVPPLCLHAAAHFGTDRVGEQTTTFVGSVLHCM